MTLSREKDYANVFLAKDQYWVDKKTNFKSKISEIVNIINYHTNIDFDWTLKENTSLLSNKKLNLIQNKVATSAQNSLKAIISPYVEPKIKSIFGHKIEYDIRVSAQIKGVWNNDFLKKNKKVFYKNGVFFEDKNFPNFVFPTRGHQDLDNNGNRSSHTLIFYFQLTHPFKNSSLLEYGINNKDMGLLEFNNQNGYSNEIPDNVLESINWNVKGLNPGEIALMSPLTIHRSTKVSEIPRVALNVKIQPTNLDYLESIYGYDLNYCKVGKNSRERIIKLFDLLEEASIENRLLLFEKSVCAFLLKDYNNAFSAIREFCLFDISDFQIKKMLLGSILRKIIALINEEEFKFYDNPMANIRELSCAESILNTVKTAT